MDKKDRIIVVLLIVVVFQTAGLVYLWQMPTQPSQETTLIIGQITECTRNIHPQLTRGESNHIVAQIFEGLFGFIDGTHDLEPILAADMGTVSEDGLNYTIPLRQGIKFHDGTDFNATAVKNHFDLMFVLKLGMTYFIHQSLLNRTEIVDTYTVRFVLNYANTAFRTLLCNVIARIPSPTATLQADSDAANLQNYLSGTGPFKFESRIIDTEVVLKANQDWWRLQPGQRVSIDKLVFLAVQDQTTRKLAVETGNIHLALGELNENDYASMMANPDLTTYDISTTSSARWLAFALNESLHDVFPNKTLRQAFAYAINYDVIMDDIYEGRAERLYSYLPSDYEGWLNVSRYNYNTTKALELIDEAGHTAPVPITLYTTGAYTAKEADVVQVIKEYALPAGFDVTISFLEIGVYREQYRQGILDVSLWRWRPEYPAADNWNVPFMSSYGYATSFTHIMSSDMAGLYPYLDDLVQEVAGTSNQTRYLEILEELQVTWDEWVPNLMLYRPNMYQFGVSNLKGIVWGPLQWDIRYYNAYFD